MGTPPFGESIHGVSGRKWHCMRTQVNRRKTDAVRYGACVSEIEMPGQTKTTLCNRVLVNSLPRFTPKPIRFPKSPNRIPKGIYCLGAEHHASSVAPTPRRARVPSHSCRITFLSAERCHPNCTHRFGKCLLAHRHRHRVRLRARPCRSLARLRPLGQSAPMRWTPEHVAGPVANPGTSRSRHRALPMPSSPPL